MQIVNIQFKSYIMVIEVLHLSPDFSIIGIHLYVSSYIKSTDNIIKNTTKIVGPLLEPWGTPESTGNAENF